MKAIKRKLARLAAGGKPRVLDLFAGCGGLSLGFQAADFTISAAVESDVNAARSHGLNFHDEAAEYSKVRDITQVSPEELVAELTFGPMAEAVDVIVGGPPCQAFARVGRPKLREIDAHLEAFRRDPRARLYQEYLHYALGKVHIDGTNGLTSAPASAHAVQNSILTNPPWTRMTIRKCPSPCYLGVDIINGFSFT